MTLLTKKLCGMGLAINSNIVLQTLFNDLTKKWKSKFRYFDMRNQWSLSFLSGRENGFKFYYYLLVELHWINVDRSLMRNSSFTDVCPAPMLCSELWMWCKQKREHFTTLCSDKNLQRSQRSQGKAGFLQRFCGNEMGMKFISKLIWT